MSEGEAPPIPVSTPQEVPGGAVSPLQSSEVSPDRNEPVSGQTEERRDENGEKGDDANGESGVEADQVADVIKVVREEIKDKTEREQVETVIGRVKDLLRGLDISGVSEEVKQVVASGAEYNSSNTRGTISPEESERLASLARALAEVSGSPDHPQSELAKFCFKVLQQNLRVRIAGEQGQSRDYTLTEWKALNEQTNQQQGEVGVQALREKALWGFVFAEDNSQVPQPEAAKEQKPYDLVVDKAIEDIRALIGARQAEGKSTKDLVELLDRVMIAQSKVAKGEQGAYQKYLALQELKGKGFKIGDEVYEQVKKDGEEAGEILGIGTGVEAEAFFREALRTGSLAKYKDIMEGLFGKEIDPSVIEMLKNCKTEEELKKKDVALFALLLAALGSVVAAWDTTKKVVDVQGQMGGR